MDFWATVGVVARRWYIVVPTFLLTLVGVVALYLTSPTTYESSAVLLLHPPATGGVAYANGFRPDQVNPLLNSGNNLNIATTVLIQAMHTTEFADSIGVPTDRQTILDVNNGSDNPELLLQGPFVFVTVDSPSAPVAEALVERAVAAAGGELAHSQATIGAPQLTYVELTEIVAPSEPLAQRGSKLRSAGAALVLGFIFSLAAGFALESFLERRGRRGIKQPAATPNGVGVGDVSQMSVQLPVAPVAPPGNGSPVRDSTLARHGG